MVRRKNTEYYVNNKELLEAMTSYRERVIYIMKIVVLICIIAWLLFTNRERYVEEYNAKIEALEQKVDSLHGINDELTFKIDTLNNEIVKLDKEINV